MLAVKDNQPTLHAEVREAFVSALDNEVAHLRHYHCKEKGHGRQEWRVVWVLPAAKYLSCQAAWLGLRTLVRVLRVVTCPVSGAETIETRYFLRSLRPSARRLARVIRSHWMIENGLHWVWDVVFGEDARRL